MSSWEKPSKNNQPKQVESNNNERQQSPSPNFSALQELKRKPGSNLVQGEEKKGLERVLKEIEEENDKAISQLGEKIKSLQEEYDELIVNLRNENNPEVVAYFVHLTLGLKESIERYNKVKKYHELIKEGRYDEVIKEQIPPRADSSTDEMER